MPNPFHSDSWVSRQNDLVNLSRRQLFLVGGVPRSGTTWVQLLLDAHPEISCRGEGLLMQSLAAPLDNLVAAWRGNVDDKNRTVFAGVSGYPQPDQADADMLLGTAVLCAFARQMETKMALAIGEKTPENVFFYSRFRRLFPTAKFIGIVRDPRDVLCSAWYFFHAAKAQADEAAAKTAFILDALPVLEDSARTMLALQQDYPASCLIVTYERLSADPVRIGRDMFRFLGVADDQAIAKECASKTSFAALSGGRLQGIEDRYNFLRKGVAGDWRSALTSDMAALIVDRLGWVFRTFEWDP